jgi:hypothetical protein
VVPGAEVSTKPYSILEGVPVRPMFGRGDRDAHIRYFRRGIDTCKQSCVVAGDASICLIVFWDRQRQGDDDYLPIRWEGEIFLIIRAVFTII